MFSGINKKNVKTFWLKKKHLCSVMITLSIRTTSIPNTMFVIKFGKVHFLTCWCDQNIAGWVVNNVGPDQMPHSAASDLCLHCLLMPVCPNTKKGYYSTLSTKASFLLVWFNYHSYACEICGNQAIKYAI